MRTALKVLFAAILLWMAFVTFRASLTLSLWSAWGPYAGNPWAVATLWDAYSGFTIFFCWVAYKEPSWAQRAIWLVLIMGLGNIATSLYLLIQLFRLRGDEPVSALLRRRT
jgi:hypothetical protein